MIFTKKRRMNLPKKDIYMQDAFTIDWKNAVLEAENHFNNIQKINKDFSDILLSAKIMNDVKICAKEDNVDRYLDILQDHRKSLKPDTLKFI